MRTSAVIRVVAWGVTVVVLLGVLVLGMRGGLWTGNGRWAERFFWRSNAGVTHTDQYDNADLYQAGNASIAAQDVSSIHIDWISGGVRVELHDGDAIEIEETAANSLSQEHQLRWLVRDGRLTVRFLRAGRTSNTPSKELTLRLPRELETLVDVSIDAVSSPIKLEELRALSVDVETVSGDITAHGLVSDVADCETISGKVYLQGRLVRISGNSISGDFTFLCDDMPEAAEVETVSGRVVLEVPDGDFVALLDSASGEMSSNFTGASVNKSAVIHGSRGPTFEFESVSGDVAVNRRFD